VYCEFHEVLNNQLPPILFHHPAQDLVTLNMFNDYKLEGKFIGEILIFSKNPQIWINCILDCIFQPL